MLLGNLKSGKQNGRCELETFQHELESWGWQVSAHAIDLRQVTNLTRQASNEHCDLVIVAGGDGTIRAAATGLLDSPVPMLILPCGTGNDLARSLGMPLDPHQALQLARTGVPVAIDVGEVNGIPFLNVVAIGVSARVCREIDTSVKRRWGPLAYVLKAMAFVMRPPLMPIRLTVDGIRQELWAYQVSIANGISFGGGWRVSDEASLCEQLLDVVVIGPMHLRTFLRKLFSPGGGLAGNLATSSWRVPTCRVDVGKDVPANMDGDAITLRSPLEFRVRPGALRVMVPAEALQAGLGMCDIA